MSTSELMELTGRASKTIRARLAGLEPLRRDGRTLWWDPRLALPRILLGIDGDLDLTHERARLARAQSEHQEMKNAELRGELVRHEDVIASEVEVIQRIKARVLQIPNRAAPLVAVENDRERCFSILDHEARAALTDLAQGFTRGLEARQRRRQEKATP